MTNTDTDTDYLNLLIFLFIYFTAYPNKLSDTYDKELPADFGKPMYSDGILYRD